MPNLEASFRALCVLASIASELLTELEQKAHNNVLFRFVRSPKSRLYGEARRGTLACAGFLLYQSVNPSSLATII
jgi:hypothetical protein